MESRLFLPKLHRDLEPEVHGKGGGEGAVRTSTAPILTFFRKERGSALRIFKVAVC